MQAALDLVDLEVVPVFVFDDIKLPLGRIEVGGVENLSVDGALWMEKIGLESFIQAIEVGDEGHKAGMDLFFQFCESLFVCFDPLKDLRLDIRESEAKYSKSPPSIISVQLKSLLFR